MRQRPSRTDPQSARERDVIRNHQQGRRRWNTKRKPREGLDQPCALHESACRSRRNKAAPRGDRSADGIQKDDGEAGDLGDRHQRDSRNVEHETGDGDA